MSVRCVVALMAGLAGPLAAQQPQAVTYDVAPPFRSVAQVQLGGQYLLLSDGTRWEIAPEDRATVGSWGANASITIRLIGAPILPYEYQLTNAEADRVAAARFAGRGRVEAQLEDSLLPARPEAEPPDSQ